MTLLEAARYYRELAENSLIWPVQQIAYSRKWKCTCGAYSPIKQRIAHDPSCLFAQAEKALEEAER